MARRIVNLIKEEENNQSVVQQSQAISPEVIQKNALIDKQIADIGIQIEMKKKEIAELITKQNELAATKSMETATDAAKNTKNSQNKPVDLQQVSQGEGTQQTKESTKESFDIDNDLGNLVLEDDEDFHDKPTSFIFDTEDREYPSIDDIYNSLLEDDDENFDEYEDEDEYDYDEDEEDNEEDGENDYEDEDEEKRDNQLFYIYVDDKKSNEHFLGKVYKKFENSKWREKLIYGESDTFGTKSYMEYLTEEEIIDWLKEDYNDNVEIVEEDQIDEIISDRFDKEY